jgi:hypothetical protein
MIVRYYVVIQLSKQNSVRTSTMAYTDARKLLTKLRIILNKSSDDAYNTHVNNTTTNQVQSTAPICANNTSTLH